MGLDNGHTPLKEMIYVVCARTQQLAGYFKLELADNCPWFKGAFFIAVCMSFRHCVSAIGRSCKDLYKSSSSSPPPPPPLHYSPVRIFTSFLGFLTISFLWWQVCRPVAKLQPGGPVHCIDNPRGRVAQSYPPAPGIWFSSLLRHAFLSSVTKLEETYKHLLQNKHGVFCNLFCRNILYCLNCVEEVEERK